MLRAILIALAGQVFFILSVLTMIPLRIKPIANYNLFYIPIMAIIFFFLFYRLCIEEKESKSYLYGFFAALVAWPLLAEAASLPVPEGIITQFSGLDIKTLGGYYYVIAGWIMLMILWRTKAIKNSFAVFLLTFLSIWSFELYMDNYSSKVPAEVMPLIGNLVAIVAVLISIVLINIARKSPKIETKTVMGCLLYITLALIIMGLGQWKKPSSFYLKYESAHIEQELKELQEEKEHIKKLKAYMKVKGW
jgi:hypothetical protein